MPNTLTNKAYIILNPYRYHYEILESIINNRHTICGTTANNASRENAPDKIIIMMLEYTSYSFYISNKYKNKIQLVYLNDAHTHKNGIANQLDNVINNLQSNSYALDDIYTINATYYDISHCPEKDKHRRNVYTSLGKYAAYRNSPNYYYVIHDIPTVDTHLLNSDNILCMTPLQRKPIPTLQPRILPCIQLPYVDNIDALIHERAIKGYPTFLIQGSITRRDVTTLRGALLRINTIYPECPKFEIHVVSDKVNILTGLHTFRNIIKIYKHRDYLDYHSKTSKCWGIIPLVCPERQTQYYAPEHILDTTRIVKKTPGYSLTSSINYGEAYKHHFVIEKHLYDVYSRQYNNVIGDIADNDSNGSTVNGGWPWLRDNSTVYESNNLSSDDKSIAFLHALYTAITRYYDEHKNKDIQ